MLNDGFCRGMRNTMYYYAKKIASPLLLFLPMITYFIMGKMLAQLQSQSMIKYDL
jgi:hypothetical protein